MGCWSLFQAGSNTCLSGSTSSEAAPRSACSNSGTTGCPAGGSGWFAMATFPGTRLSPGSVRRPACQQRRRTRLRPWKCSRHAAFGARTLRTRAAITPKPELQVRACTAACFEDARARVLPSRPMRSSLRQRPASEDASMSESGLGAPAGSERIGKPCRRDAREGTPGSPRRRTGEVGASTVRAKRHMTTAHLAILRG